MPPSWSPAAAPAISWARPRRACGSSASSWTASPAASPGPSTPTHDIRIENFRDTKLPEGSIDAVIGNVPFADVKLDYRGEAVPLHDFFFAKSLDALKPGGVLALVTSHFTLDKQNAAIREYLAERADFLGAIRLPSDAFKREGTAVVTDIVFLAQTCRRRASRTTPTRTGCEVEPLDIEGARVPINRYFLNHPEMVLGTWSRKDRLYGGRLQRHRQRRPGRAARRPPSAGCPRAIAPPPASGAGRAATSRFRPAAA